MNNLVQDLFYSLRMLAKTPAFTAVALITLALGIGANTAIFSVVEAVLLKPLPFPSAEKLVQIWEISSPASQGRDPVSPLNFSDWQTQAHSFDHMSLYQFESFIIPGESGVERLTGLMVSANFFETLGVNPMLGRTFASDEGQPERNRVVVLSHKFWVRWFHQDPNILGAKLLLNKEPFTVVGVMPPIFEFPSGRIDIWTWPAFDPKGVTRGSHFLYAIGRIKSESSLEQAQIEMNTIARRLNQQYPDTNKDVGINLVSLHEQIVGRIRRALLILWGTVILVLLMASGTLANLMLIRAELRRKEFALRSALGASRTRLAQQLLVESLVLAVIGGALGLVVATLATKLIISTGYAIPRFDKVNLNGWVLFFTAFISVFTGIILGLAPTRALSNPNLRTALNEDAAGTPTKVGRLRSRGLLIVCEIALALVVITGAGLMMTSLSRLLSVDPGFKAEGRLTMQLSLPENKYPNGAERAVAFQNVIDRIAVMPAIEHVSAVNDLPFSGSRTKRDFQIYADTLGSLESMLADYRIVGPDYFGTMGIQILKGRDFTKLDSAGKPLVAIINDTLARKYFPAADPLGKRLKLRGKVLEIVGIVSDLTHQNLATGSSPEIYAPLMQADPPTWIFLVLRGGPAPEQLINPVRKAVREVDSDVPVYDVQTMQERLNRSLRTERFTTTLLALFAALALVLAAVGVYGLINYSVTPRTKEIGLRMALGARQSQVLRLVLADGMIYTGVGLAVGLLAVFWSSKAFSVLLYGVKPHDPPIVLGSLLLLAILALLASYIPARRAMRVDPLRALRNE